MPEEDAVKSVDEEIGRLSLDISYRVDDENDVEYNYMQESKYSEDFTQPSLQKIEHANTENMQPEGSSGVEFTGSGERGGTPASRSPGSRYERESC